MSRGLLLLKMKEAARNDPSGLYPTLGYPARGPASWRRRCVNSLCALRPGCGPRPKPKPQSSLPPKFVVLGFMARKGPGDPFDSRLSARPILRANNRSHGALTIHGALSFTLACHFYL